MDAQRETTKGQITFRLAYREGFLCVLGERGSTQSSESTTAKLWYPIREAEEAEVLTLLGRPVTELDPKEGIYVDEEGAVYQLAQKGETEPMAVEEIPGEAGKLAELLTASLKNGNSSGGVRTHALQRPTGRRRKKVALETQRSYEAPHRATVWRCSRRPAGVAHSLSGSEQPPRPGATEPAPEAGRSAAQDRLHPEARL